MASSIPSKLPVAAMPCMCHLVCVCVRVCECAYTKHEYVQRRQIHTHTQIDINTHKSCRRNSIPGNPGNPGNSDIPFFSVAASPPSNPSRVPPLPPGENSGMGLENSPSYPAPLPREDEALSALSRISADDGEEDSCQKAPSSRHSSSALYLGPHDCELASTPVATTVAFVASDALPGLFCVCEVSKETYY